MHLPGVLFQSLSTHLRQNSDFYDRDTGDFELVDGPRRTRKTFKKYNLTDPLFVFPYFASKYVHRVGHKTKQYLEQACRISRNRELLPLLWRGNNLPTIFGLPNTTTSCTVYNRATAFSRRV